MLAEASATFTRPDRLRERILTLWRATDPSAGSSCARATFRQKMKENELWTAQKNGQWSPQTSQTCMPQPRLKPVRLTHLLVFSCTVSPLSLLKRPALIKSIDTGLFSLFTPVQARTYVCLVRTAIRRIVSSRVLFHVHRKVRG